jgi:pilus assembly protein CpaE
VDPDRESTTEIQKMLSMLGFAVIGSTGYGVEAVALAHQMRPDLVLMRVEEPLVRPIQTLSRLNDGMPDLPIVVFSTEANIRLMRQAMVAGASDYLQEPLSPEEVEQSIIRVLERKEREHLRREGRLEEPVPQGTVITIFGATGGIGKTTIASNLAIALVTEAHQTVALVDMDTRFGDWPSPSIPIERRSPTRSEPRQHRPHVVERYRSNASPGPHLPDAQATSETHGRHVRTSSASPRVQFVILARPAFNGNRGRHRGGDGDPPGIRSTPSIRLRSRPEMLNGALATTRSDRSSSARPASTRACERRTERTLDSPLGGEFRGQRSGEGAQLGRPVVMSRPNGKVTGNPRIAVRAGSATAIKQKGSLSK